MRRVRTPIIRIAATLACLGVAACEIAGIDDIELKGTAFTRALAEQYSELALLEADKPFDRADAEYFSRKARGAARGDPVAPADPRNWNLRKAHLDQLLPAHAALVWALDNFGRVKAPLAAARAQTGFDCWVERAEDDRDAALIQECRDRFRDGYTVTRNAIK